MQKYSNKVLKLFNQLETLPPIHILTTPNVSSVPATGATVATNKRAMFMYDSAAGDYILLWTT